MKIHYINLDSNKNRNERILNELTLHDLRKFSERFPGVLAKAPLNGMSLSETGCLLAHYHTLLACKKEETTIILEDDAILCPSFRYKIENLSKKIEHSDFDFIYLGQTVDYFDLKLHLQLLKFLNYSKKNQKSFILDAQNFYRYGAFGYIVNGNSVSKIHELLKNLDLSKSAKPIDILMRNWFTQGTFKAGLVFPYFVGIDSTLQTSMFDRKGGFKSKEHTRLAELVNLYLEGYSPNINSDWQKIISENPNPHALEICKSIYFKLNEN